MNRKLTKAQAIEKLVKTRMISTDMLQPLNFSFENFLRFAKLPKAAQEEIINKLIAFYQAPLNEKHRIIKQLTKD